MPIPPAQAPTTLIAQTGFSAANGATTTPPPTQVVSLPQSAPPVTSNASSTPTLIGIDIVPFSLTLAGGQASQTFTFAQLPHRNNTQNPLTPSAQAAQQPYAVKAIDHLIFTAALQNVNAPAGTTVSVQPVAIDQHNVRCPGPFLGSNVFLSFQVVITVTSTAKTGTVSGMVAGQLVLSCG